jgi:hypothetical protein
MVRLDESPLLAALPSSPSSLGTHKGDGAVNGRRNFYQGTRASLADRCP